jgi:hypothetical protein
MGCFVHGTQCPRDASLRKSRERTVTGTLCSGTHRQGTRQPVLRIRSDPDLFGWILKHISAQKISEEVCPRIYIGKDPDPDVSKSRIRIRTFSKVGSGSGQKSSGSATLPRTIL